MLLIQSTTIFFFWKIYCYSKRGRAYDSLSLAITECSKRKRLNTKFTTNLMDFVSSHPLKPQTFKNKIYFVCDMTAVASNANRDNFARVILSVDDVKNMCTPEYGAWIILKMKNNFSHLFKFVSNILECSESMLFYSNSPTIQCIQYVKKVMRDVKDKSLLGSQHGWWMNTLGDKAGFISPPVSNHYDKLMMEADMKAQAEE